MGTLPPPRSILITGASSGLGAALAKAYAEDGVFLALGGRDGERLGEVAAECRARGAVAEVRVADVTDCAAMGAWIEATDDRRPLDLVMANAAIALGTSGLKEFDAQTRRIVDVNVIGVLNTVHPAIPRMRTRRAGQIAVVSSIAGFHGIPGAASYAASKAFVRSYGEGLRGLLAPDGIRVSVVCPGFVRTRMVANNRQPMPFIMSGEKAAGIIKRGLARNKARIGFPLPMLFMSWLGGSLPAAWADPIFVRMPRKH